MFPTRVTTLVMTTMVGVAYLGVPATANAAFIVASDDFSNDSASLAAWTAETAVTLSVADDSGGLGSGNALFAAPSASVNHTLFEFPEVTLTETGDWIQVNLDFRLDGTFKADRFTPAIGLFEKHGNVTGNVGYTAFVSSQIHSADSVGLGRDTQGDADILAGGDTSNLFGLGSQADIASGNNYTLELRVTRNAAGQAVIDFALGGAGNYTMNATDTGANPVMSFTSFGIRNRSNNFAIDNFVVTTIPEPSALLLLGMGMAGWLAFGRRRRGATSRS